MKDPSRQNLVTSKNTLSRSMAKAPDKVVEQRPGWLDYGESNGSVGSNKREQLINSGPAPAPTFLVNDGRERIARYFPAG